MFIFFSYVSWPFVYLYLKKFLFKSFSHLQIRQFVFLLWGFQSYNFPGYSVSKEPACNTGNLGLIPGLGRSPGGGHGSPLQYFCLVNPCRQRSLVGCSQWGHKESDTIEQLSTAKEFVIYSGYQIFIRYMVGKYFLSFCRLSFHFLDSAL